MSTISGSINHTATLTSGAYTPGSGTYGSPLTITGTINAGSGDGVYGSYASAWTVTNSGSVIAIGDANSNGIDLVGGGLITNGTSPGSTALIRGSNYGVRTSNNGFAYDYPATLINNGMITASGAGGIGVALWGSASTVINAGTISSAQGHYTLELQKGGYLSNASTGYIGAGGVYIGRYGGAGTVVNQGRILDKAGSGIYLFTGGTVTNFGTISGTSLNSAVGGGVEITGGDGSVVNHGLITNSNGAGVRLDPGATSGTVIDSGTISGSGANPSVIFQDSGPNLLGLEAGYKLTGYVGGGGASNTLELLGSAGGPLSVNYNGLTLTNFQDVLFGPGGNATLKVSNTTGTLPETISGFGTVSDIIDLTAIGTNGTVSQVGTLLTVTGSSGMVTLQLDSSDASNFTVTSDGTSGTDLSIACFRRSTRILTDRGEVPVEELAAGDLVVTPYSGVQPIKWIGRRAYAGRFIAGNKAVLPIRISAGALAAGIPARDLFVSPEHALYLDGRLLAARLLVNGATITQADSIDEIEYFHIELEAHDVLFAEGAPAESFVDCDNRRMFQNADEFAALYPDDDRPAWQFCAPRLESEAPELAAIRAGLWERAEALGHVLHADPDLHLIVDGEIVRPERIGSRAYRFAISAGSGAVWLASRSTVPAELDAAGPDHRRLGVPLESLTLENADLSMEVGHSHPLLSEGFHPAETSHRWTDGMARLPAVLLQPFAGALAVEVRLADSGLRYPVAPGRAAAAA